MATRAVRLLCVTVAGVASLGAVEFNRDVRPILSDKCFACHGPDAAAKKIPFRLDREADARPKLAAVIDRITTPKASLKMPPVYTGVKLSEAEIQTLREWVTDGAKWQKHWSFLPPERPAPPRSTRNPIDAFVLTALERNNLKPSPRASKETLIRRVTLDITGLPPTPAEVDAFVSDQSPNAYEKLVDRLLASPRYGERMAVRWLDAARYADTNGYQFDGERVMWRWRDWVIDSFNRNQRFDQFAVEQLAGDLLPNATLDQKIATGFNRNHRANTEDGIVPEEYAVEYVVDRVETASTVFLGLTMGCARCHNHKYDPLTQKDFYQMYAYFNNIPEAGRAMKYGNSPPLIPAPTADQKAVHDRLLAKIAADEAWMQRRSQAVAAGQRKWESLQMGAAASWWNPESGLTASFYPGRNSAFDGTKVIDGGQAGNFDIDEPFTLAARVYSDGTPDGSVMSRMVDSPKGKGYGVHVDNGKVHVNLTSTWESDAIRVETVQTLAPKRWHHVVMTYDGSVSAAGVKVFIDGKPAELKVLMDTLYRPFRNAGRQFTQPFRIGGGWGKERRFRGHIDDVLLFSRVLGGREIAAMSLESTIAELAAKPEAKRTPAERDALRWFYLEKAADPEVREVWARLTNRQREREKLERTFPSVMVMAEKPQPEPTHLLLRGAYDKPGPVVERAVPAVLHPLPQGVKNDRLALATWVVDPANPLTARVTVNRFWQMFFGIGLVKTTEDFGLQGEYPVNPDLLDWLATEFVRTGWDAKALVRLMVTSDAYQQTATATPELLQRDPDNRLLARGPRHRLPPEMVRDQALAAAGLLTERLGGPSVKPYQPEGLWKEQSMQDMDYIQSKGPDLYRRSLYTFWKRTIPPPMMINFDAANREACVVRETRTNTPLQALNLMNDTTFVEAARFIGQRMMKEGGSEPESRLRYGFRLLTARAPKPQEMEVLRGNLQYHRDYFSSDAKRAKDLLAHGDSPADPALDTRELAAYASVASLMLNMDEVISKP